MLEEIRQKYPSAYNAIKVATEASGFTMPSEVLTCSLLKTLAATKPGGKFLELGTGTGLSTTWILDGMDEASTLISIDNDETLLNIAKENLGVDKRLKLICTDGADWIKQNAGQKYGFIFADTWPGKYLLLDEVLDMIEKGGIYIIDDMLPQANWPTGHAEKATDLISYLDSREDIILTKMGWATGIVIITKK
ncbi:O-methyltransferase [Mucilaginibacter sp. L3T2-6]|uniref:O-methyltransferase n=1 Tax=Mucilaginibacter sp. L3T2-6 TaxID=3062491 RepID=UPI002676E978|nr:class I SAM-dependent methyltransferase [Mucilaginibacter sp. L3T2-6]MDO3641464.1 class I SAM-dependent methyltransferase [Mucilaginibacter sp. L3T2-6]MDV6213775.1 class I SAM-dependent methyltransferase [Mucilaginibacter sp. L3T2-6]